MRVGETSCEAVDTTAEEEFSGRVQSESRHEILGGDVVVSFEFQFGRDDTKETIFTSKLTA